MLGNKSLAQNMEDMAQETETMEAFDGDGVGTSERLEDTEALIHSTSGHFESDNRDIYLIEKIVQTWREQHQADIEMRKSYAMFLLAIVAVATLLVFCIFFDIGKGILQYDAVTVRIFLGASYLQLLGLIFVIVKYLFSRNSHVILKDIAEITGRLKSRR